MSYTQDGKMDKHKYRNGNTYITENKLKNKYKKCCKICVNNSE